MLLLFLRHLALVFLGAIHHGHDAAAAGGKAEGYPVWIETAENRCIARQAESAHNTGRIIPHRVHQTMRFFLLILVRQGGAGLLWGGWFGHTPQYSTGKVTALYAITICIY